MKSKNKMNSPCHALYYGGYEYARQVAYRWFGSKRSRTTDIISQGIAGTFAELVANVTFGTPYDVIKQKAQVYASPGLHSINGPAVVAAARPFSSAPPTVESVSSWYIAKSIVRNEGVRGLYRGMSATLLLWCPFASLYFISYEAMKHKAHMLKAPQVGLKGGSSANYTQHTATTGNKTVRRNEEEGEKELPPLSFPLTLLLGAAAGIIATVATNPIDVVRTRLQVQGSSGGPGTVVRPEKYRGVLDAFSQISRQEGAAAFGKGLFARLLWTCPWTAIGIASFEACKGFLTDQKAFPSFDS